MKRAAMKRAALSVCLLSCVIPVVAQQQRDPRPAGGGHCSANPLNCVDAPNPLTPLDTVWLEEMTWMDVRDAMKAGKTDDHHSDGRQHARHAGARGQALRPCVGGEVPDGAWCDQGGVTKEGDKSDELHDDPAITFNMLITDPNSVRWEQRVRANKATIDGVSIANKAQSLAIARKVVDFRAGVTASAIRKAIAARPKG